MREIEHYYKKDYPKGEETIMGLDNFKSNATERLDFMIAELNEHLRKLDIRKKKHTNIHPDTEYIRQTTIDNEEGFVEFLQGCYTDRYLKYIFIDKGQPAYININADPKTLSAHPQALRNAKWLYRNIVGGTII
tara:strand:+ start:350 stop:751 length:402 start_codon:yes stop_codon:yes gene_type:complete